MHKLEFVSAVGAEDEFELEENRVDVTPWQEEIFFEEIMIVLQSNLGELSGIPGEIRANP